MRYIIGESFYKTMPLDESVISDIGNQIMKAGRGVKDWVIQDFKKCKTFEECLRTLSKYVAMGLITITLAHGIIKRTFPQHFQELIQRLDNEIENPWTDEEELSDDEKMRLEELHQKKVEEVENLMKYVAELNGRSKKLELSAENIVSLCEKYNFPLPLLLAQAHIESHFGTTPRAQRTNSVFSVGSWDNGNNKCVYPSKDASVEPYIKLMLNDYLNDKTVEQLLTPGSFINQNGHRYSSNKNYENEINRTINGLIRRYCPSCFQE